MFENLKYIIFDMSEIDKIDFTQVKEDSVDTLLLSNDGLKSFVHWDSDIEPSFVADITTKQGIYTNDDILQIMMTEEWVRVPYSGTTN